MHPVIAVDFGGTHIRAALFPTEHPHPSKLIKTKTLASQDPVPVVERAVAAIEEIAPHDESKLRIGIASPGLLDHNKEGVLDASNLPGWENFPLKAEIESGIYAHISVEMIQNSQHLASLVHALNPSRVVIGGGMAQIGELLFNPIREVIVDEIILPAFLESVEVLPAKLGDNSGLIGAKVLAREA